jgi:hypothetical protein
MCMHHLRAQVDRLREHVLYLNPSELEALIGVQAVTALLETPRRFCRASVTSTTSSEKFKFRLFDCFLRRYSPDTASGNQLLTSFHADTAALTVNIALTSDVDVEGGRLLGAYDGAVRLIKRSEGDATVHSSALLHGVTRMRAGTRYSMIMFFAI